MKSTTLDAVFEDGVFKPARQPSLPQGQRARITIETEDVLKPGDILRLAQRVYTGLTASEIVEVDEAAQRRRFFTSQE